MAAAFCCIIYVGLIVLVGCATTAAILGLGSSSQHRRRPIVETLGLVLSLGIGMTGTLLIWLSMLGLRPSSIALDLITVLALGTLVFLWRAGRIPFSVVPKIDWQKRSSLLLSIPILVLVGVNLIATIPALRLGQYEWDAAVIWTLKAKVLFNEALLWPRPAYFNDVTLSFSHLDYPLLLPAVIAGAYGAMGHVDETLGKIVLPIIFAADTLVAYTAARMWVGRLMALVLTVLLISPGYTVLQASVSNADVTLALFYLGSILYLLRWLKGRDRADMILAGLFSMFLATTKQEGLPLAGINAVVLLVVCVMSKTSAAWKDYVLFILILGSGVGIWLVWRIGIPHTNDDYTGRLTLSLLHQNAGRIPVIFRGYLEGFADVKACGLLWVLIPVIALLGFKALAWPATTILWLLLILQMAVYSVAYMITVWPDVRDLQAHSLQRLLIHAAPAAMMIIAAHWSATQVPKEGVA